MMESKFENKDSGVEMLARYQDRLNALYEKHWVRKDPVPFDDPAFLAAASRPYSQQWYAVKFSFISDLIQEASTTGEKSLYQDIDAALHDYENIDHNQEMRNV